MKINSECSAVETIVIIKKKKQNKKPSIRLCFSHLNSYGHYAEGTGSVLKMADIDVRCAFDLSFLKPRSFYFFFDVPSLADFI